MHSKFLRSSATLLASLALVPCAISAEEKKPNIIYIIVDDMGYGDLSCYGQKGWKTPNIDTLATEGMKFTSHYSGSTVCAPARSCLMTGQDQGHTYIRGNGPLQLRKEDTVVAELVKAAGYTTGMIGKSCVTGNTQDAQCPHDCGFDYFYGTLSHMTAHHHYPKSVWHNGKAEEIPGNNVKSGEVFIQNRYTDKALDFVTNNKEKPFMLVLSYSTPHADVCAPEEDVKPFIGKFENEKAYKGGHYKACKHLKATYAGMVANLDKNVGRLLAKLKELGLEENTVVSFTSDNGPHNAGGYHYNMHDSNGVLRGGKRDLYEGGIRVPFLVKWPAKIKAGSSCDHPSAFWDFLPTACELAGAEIPGNIQGVSYVPSMLGKEQPKHPFLYWEFHEQGGKVALRQGDWKLVGLNRSSNNPRPYELYNLKDDLEESKNLAKENPEKVKELAKLLENHRSPSENKKWNFNAGGGNKKNKKNK